MQQLTEFPIWCHTFNTAAMTSRSGLAAMTIFHKKA